MELIFTAGQGDVAYWTNRKPQSVRDRAFRMGTRFTKTARRVFVQQRVEPANMAHAPLGYDGALTSDLALAFLYRVAGQR